MDATRMLDEIAVFVHVVEAGSFTQAAKQRGVPKSTLSRSVGRLEDALKTRLLVRTSRTLTLTEEGRRFFAQAAPHVSGLREAATVAKDCEAHPHGTLRVTAPVDVGEAYLGEILTRFALRHPTLRLEVDFSARTVNLVEEGFDLAVRAAQRIKDESLVARKLMETDLQLYASPGYLARRGTPRTLDELRLHDHVIFGAGETQEMKLRTPDGVEQGVTLAGRIAGTEFTVLRSALRAGAGVGPLPTFAALRDVEEGRLVRVLPGWMQVAGTLYVVYPAARHVPKKVTLFRDFVVESFRKLAQVPG